MEALTSIRGCVSSKFLFWCCVIPYFFSFFWYRPRIPKTPIISDVTYFFIKMQTSLNYWKRWKNDFLATPCLVPKKKDKGVLKLSEVRWWKDQLQSEDSIIYLPGQLKSLQRLQKKWSFFCDFDMLHWILLDLWQEDWASLNRIFWKQINKLLFYSGRKYKYIDLI